MFTQSPKWSQRSFEAIVKETITQPDGETRLIVERTTEIYGNPANSLGISKDTKLLDADGKNISAKDILSGSSVKVTVKDAFNEETPFYYPVVYEINYPVVQGADNQYYLKHLFNGKWNSSGCIFLDSRNTPDFSDRHSIIYGHHMKNGTMFSGLTEYKKQEFYDAHPTVLLLTPEKNIRIEIFAGYVAGVSDKAWEIALGSDKEFGDWLEAAEERSCFESEVPFAVTDRIVTLSTCSYEFDNARFVLVGRITE